ncbi:MAG: GNAT family N-acetyltransferase [Limnohabitans sp.]|jgi:mycothiol synthase|nr:GNAT family N-acetyltransferase [Limnohabitans sp.]
MNTAQPSPSPHGSDDARVERVRSERLPEAIGALLGAGPAACERFVRQAAHARVRLDFGWAIVDATGRYRMAVFAIPSPGRAVMLLATHPRDAIEAERLGKAIDQAAVGSREIADIAQALLDPAHAYDPSAFQAGGLVAIATLDYLERSLPRAGVLPKPAPLEGWAIESAASPEALGYDDPSRLPPATVAEIVRVLESSYIATQDCPGLAGLRKTEDVLVGHFGTGARPRFWLLARDLHDPQRHARGVALVHVSHDGATAELVYLGLAPEARGKGLARAMLLHGLSLASAARCTSMQLAVDAKNHAARKLYDALGFRKTSARLALVRGLRV